MKTYKYAISSNIYQLKITRYHYSKNSKNVIRAQYCNKLSRNKMANISWCSFKFQSIVDYHHYTNKMYQLTN